MSLFAAFYDARDYNGVIVSGLVAFHPHVISAFDPDRYFQNKP